MPQGPPRALRVFLLLMFIAWRADAAEFHAVRQPLSLHGASGQLFYMVTRNGESIGHYLTRFRHANNRLTVTNEISVEIKLAFATVYSFRHGSTEIWRDGRLESLVARTNDDGASTRVSYGRAGVSKSEGETTSDCAAGQAARVAPGSFWSEALLFHECVIDPVDGRRRPLQVTFRGVDVVQTPHGPVRTRRYGMAQPKRRELWFGPDGFLVQMHMYAKDDSLIALKRVPAIVGSLR